MIQLTCPKTERWQALLADSAAPDEASELESHLSGCTRCRSVLDDLAVGSSGWLRDANRLAGHTDADPMLTKTLHRLQDAGLDDDHGVPPIALDFLNASDQPGILGTLGRYQVLAVIGRGAMGIVLKALDPDLLRPVAVKVLAPYLAPSGTARQRFLREARAAAAVSHDHVVTIHAVEPADLPYLVMEYVTGVSLQARLDRDGPLPSKDIARIGLQAARGLEAAHAQGLVHRDVKPANILLENGVERVKLTDFGLAQAADDARLTASGTAAGTPLYMSPEQARGEKVDTRSDLFSLGSVLYALATGFPPFRATTTMGVLNRITNDPPRPIRETNPDFPAALEAIIMQLLEKNPARRIPTAADVANRLTEFLAAAPEPAKPRRGWRVAAALVIAATIVIAGVILTFKTPRGTLVVEVDDPGIKVALDGEELTITGAGTQEVRLKPGTYQLTATKDGKPAKVSQEIVTITRDGKQIVKVSMQPANARPDDEQRVGLRVQTRWQKQFPQIGGDLQSVMVSAMARSLDTTGNLPAPRPDGWEHNPAFPKLQALLVAAGERDIDPDHLQKVLSRAYELAGSIFADWKAAHENPLNKSPSKLAGLPHSTVLEERLALLIVDVPAEQKQLLHDVWADTVGWRTINRTAKDGPTPQTHPSYQKLIKLVNEAGRIQTDSKRAEEALKEAIALAKTILADTKRDRAKAAAKGPTRDALFDRRLKAVLPDAPADTIELMHNALAIARSGVEPMVVVGALPRPQTHPSFAQLRKLVLDASGTQVEPAKLATTLKEAFALAEMIQNETSKATTAISLDEHFKKIVADYEAAIARLKKMPNGRVLQKVTYPIDVEKAIASLTGDEADRTSRLLTLVSGYQYFATRLPPELSSWDKARVAASDAEKRYKSGLIPAIEYDMALATLRELADVLRTYDETMGGIVADLRKLADEFEVPAKDEATAEFKKAMADFDALVLRLAKTQVGRLLSSIQYERKWSDDDLVEAFGIDQEKIDLGRMLLRYRDQARSQAVLAEKALGESAALQKKQKELGVTQKIDERIRMYAQDVRLRTATIRVIVEDVKKLADQIDPPAKKQ
jgi:Protein kinase domain